MHEDSIEPYPPAYYIDSLVLRIENAPELELKEVEVGRRNVSAKENTSMKAATDYIDSYYFDPKAQKVSKVVSEFINTSSSSTHTFYFYNDELIKVVTLKRPRKKKTISNEFYVDWKCQTIARKKKLRRDVSSRYLLRQAAYFLSASSLMKNDFD